MKIQDMERIELEISSDCNAGCPGCARTQNIGKFGIYNHTIEDIKSWFPTRDTIEGKIFKLCGVLGDPIVNPDCLAITEYLVENGGDVHFSTNGGKQPTEFWYRLGELSGQTDQVKVHFCVDGTQTNHIYRVNTVYKVVDRNMQAYSDGGKSTGKRAEASWIFIVFDHNEHELEEAEKRAEELDFRFATRTGMRNSIHEWTAQIKKKDHKAKKVVTEEKKITTTGAKEHSKVEVVKEIDKVIETYKHKSKEEIAETVAAEQEKFKELVNSVSCKFYHDKELFIASDGTLWPCCFIWDSYFKNKDGICETYSDMPTGWNDVRKHSINEILATDYYKRVLADSWNPTHALHVDRCIRTCAKNRAYHNEIKYKK